MEKTALITGGSRGIGFGVAVELARSGFSLAINGIRGEEEVREPLGQLRSLTSRVIYVPGDISDPGQRQNIHRQVLDGLGHLNVLVNNAGIAPPERKDIMEAGEESYDRVLDVNLKGPYFLTRLFAGHMMEARQSDPGFSACIIFISSISSTVASVDRGEYCISKAGLSMAARLWAVRLGEFDIPVYEIRPGIVRTDMTGGVREKYDRLIREGLCVQERWGLPGDVGRVAAAMATGSMPYSTGQVVLVDGGLTIPRL
jgi:3-oxoacyl-[acyl-carrier protein] reductase